MSDNLSQDSRLVTARKTLARAAGKPELPTLADQLTYWAGLAGELRAALTMTLEALTLTAAQRQLLAGVITEAQERQVAAVIACPACERAEQAGVGVCAGHRAGAERADALDALAERLAALDLLPEADEDGPR